MATTTLLLHSCGFCQTGHHNLCPGAVRNATKARKDGLWVCPCDTCSGRIVNCLECKHSGEGEIDLEGWRCIDRSACTARHEIRTANHPTMILLRGIHMTTATKPAAEKVAKAPAAPKTGNCICCNGPTKGGKFQPGHDARYVSGIVDNVLAGKAKEGESRKHLNGISEALAGKFDKSLASKRAKAAKDAQAAKDAKAAKAAKDAQAKVDAKAKADAKVTE